MKKIDRICLSIVIGFSLFGILGATVFFFVKIPDSILNVIVSWVGIVGTIASVVLSIVAMIYSNKSSKDAEISLRKITEQYSTLCNELKNQAIRDNLGKNGIDRIISKCQDK